MLQNNEQKYDIFKNFASMWWKYLIFQGFNLLTKPKTDRFLLHHDILYQYNNISITCTMI